MIVSGVTIIKDGKTYDYPFVEAIKAALPLCDEFIAVVGKSEDGTREAVETIGSSKIKIVDTVWDEQMRQQGKILAQQTNVGLDHATGDWIIYVQGDEILHEDEYDLIRREMKQSLHKPSIEGLLFKYFHFWSYEYLVVTRRAYRREIRIVRNDPLIRSYRDAQGFRKYPSPEAYDQGHPGHKLKVRLINAHIYAYSRVRPPELELAKVKNFERYWHDDTHIESKYKDKQVFNYNNIEYLEPFPKSGHPAVMRERVQNASWSVDYTGPRFKLKNWFLFQVERLTGWRIGEYRNYKLVERSRSKTED